MNVLSLFDGMSCGMQALKELGIKPENYYASEIDKYAKIISNKNHPEIKQVGDVQFVTKESTFLNTKIDLLIGGSPCQSFSSAGDGTGFKGKSGLFYEFVRILKEVKPKYFLLENVSMKKEWEEEITKCLGVMPIIINSNLFSAQNRKRLYWTNISVKELPLKCDEKLKDVLQENVDSKYFYSEKAISYLDRSKINKRFANYKDAKKAKCLTAVFSKSLPYNVYVDKEESYCLTSNYANMACVNYNKGQEQIVFDNNTIRRLTPIECERLQKLPDNYTEGVSNTQRYKMIGNGWTVSVIKHIFEGLNT